MMRLIFSILIALGICVSCFHKRKEQFTVARRTSWEGVALHGVGKHIQGFTDDLLYEIAKNEKIRIDITTVDSSAEITSFLDKKGIDGVLSVLSPTVQNQRLYRFSDPFFAFGFVLVTRPTDTYSTLADLKDKVVGYERGLMGGLQPKIEFAGFLKPYDQMTYAMEDLLYGKIDAVILDSIYANQLVSGLYMNKVRMSDKPLEFINFYLVVKRGENEELIDLFNNGLHELRMQNTYKKMLEYWTLYNPS